MELPLVGGQTLVLCYSSDAPCRSCIATYTYQRLVEMRASSLEAPRSIARTGTPEDQQLAKLSTNPATIERRGV